MVFSKYLTITHYSTNDRVSLEWDLPCNEILVKEVKLDLQQSMTK